MKKTTLFLLLGLLALSPAYSQQGNGKQNGGDNKGESKSTEEDGVPRFWEVKFEDGDFMTALDKIVSISKSQYLLDGNLIVNEVTVDSGGRSLARFYHIAPVADTLTEGKAAPVARAVTRAQGLVDEAAEKAGTDVHNMAQKTYPATTHAGMIEYRIMDLKDLDAIYKSVQSAWQSGKAKRLTINK
ncbi:MAG: hypothetical protein JWO82_237 [Akkermansiaceae bacterium]|nr:hypothetical protein [Akkermansiaceae bacterium]